MKDKKSFTRQISDFLAGKGFYVVLFICTAIIGLSAWILLSVGNITDNSNTDGVVSTSMTGQEVMGTPNDIADAYASDAADSTDETSPAAATPSPTPSASPSSKPSASPTPDKTPSNNASSAPEDKTEEVMAKPLVFVWPLMGDIEVMYSVDELLYNKTMADWRTHDAIDIAGMLGAKVMAAADGTVVDVYADDLLGTTVVIDHGNGLQSIYANLAKTPVVSTGDKVAMGAVIGAVGNTALGESNEIMHLHFAITKDGNPVDPSKYLPEK